MPGTLQTNKETKTTETVIYFLEAKSQGPGHSGISLFIKDSVIQRSSV